MNLHTSFLLMVQDDLCLYKNKVSKKKVRILKSFSVSNIYFEDNRGIFFEIDLSADNLIS